jgi:hypothetical protein
LWRGSGNHGGRTISKYRLWGPDEAATDLWASRKAPALHRCLTIADRTRRGQGHRPVYQTDQLTSSATNKKGGDPKGRPRCSRSFSKLARSVLRHIRVASKQELKDRLLAAVDYFNGDPVVHTWTHKLDKAA